MRSSSRRSAPWLVVVALLLASCSIPEQDVVDGPLDDSRSAPTSRAVPLRTGGEDGPSVVDHWHIAYGFFFCDTYLPPLTVENDPIGIHSHSDGVIHVHPFSSEAEFEQATIGAFLDAARVEAADAGFRLPDAQRAPAGLFPTEGQCDGEPAQLYLIDFGSVDRAADPVALAGTPAQIAASFVGNDRTAFAIAFVSDPARVPQPPSTPNLDLLSDIPAPDPGDPSGDPELIGDPVPPLDGFGFQPVLQTLAADCAPPLATSRDGECLALGEAVDEIAVEAATVEEAASGGGQFVVNLVLDAASIVAFNDTAAACFEQSARCPTGRLAIVVDGLVITAPTIQTPSFERDAIQISGNFGRADAERLVAAIGG